MNFFSFFNYLNREVFTQDASYLPDTMGFCVCLWTGVVFFQRFTPEFGVLVLAFKQKIERRRNAALTKTHKYFMILSIVYAVF